MIRLVIDTMGSDKGSPAAVEGIQRFLKDHEDVEIYAVGRKEELVALESLPQVKIIDARDVVPMEAGALDVMRMKNSSMMVGLQYMKDQHLDGIVSCGSTGGFLSAATIKLRLMEGVERAALVSPFPTKIKGKKVTILDMGASNENTPSQLVQFAHMGKVYAESVFGIEQPKVYMLSNGAEDEKGAPEVKEAHKMLREQNFPGFCGNIEARYALDGEADVIVTGGFAGNIFLKATEGVAKMMSGMMKKAFKRNFFSKLGYLLCKKGIDEMAETMNYKNTGGAMLLGVNGVVVKGHGSNDGYSFSCAIDVAYRMAKSDMVNKLRQGLQHE